MDISIITKLWADKISGLVLLRLAYEKQKQHICKYGMCTEYIEKDELCQIHNIQFLEVKKTLLFELQHNLESFLIAFKKWSQIGATTPIMVTIDGQAFYCTGQNDLVWQYFLCNYLRDGEVVHPCSRLSISDLAEQCLYISTYRDEYRVYEVPNISNVLKIIAHVQRNVAKSEIIVVTPFTHPLMV